jgi:hypothetical protein
MKLRICGLANMVGSAASILVASFIAVASAGTPVERGSYLVNSIGGPHRPAEAVLRTRLPQKPRGICRARRVAAQSSAQGHTLNLPVRTAQIGSGKF